MSLDKKKGSKTSQNEKKLLGHQLFTDIRLKHRFSFKYTYSLRKKEYISEHRAKHLYGEVNYRENNRLGTISGEQKQILTNRRTFPVPGIGGPTARDWLDF